MFHSSTNNDSLQSLSINGYPNLKTLPDRHYNVIMNFLAFGRRWFFVDSKSFEIKVEGGGRKVQVIITERRRGRSSWIRFGEEEVRILLKEVESFRREAGKNSGGLEWWENGRRYSLESMKNVAGRFILCLIADEDGKRHRLFFPEGNGLVNGWTLLG